MGGLGGVTVGLCGFGWGEYCGDRVGVGDWPGV